jgi:hypothetical protein
MSRLPTPTPDGSTWWEMPAEMVAAYTDELRRDVGPQHPLFVKGKLSFSPVRKPRKWRPDSSPELSE